MDHSGESEMQHSNQGTTKAWGQQGQIGLVASERQNTCIVRKSKGTFQTAGTLDDYDKAFRRSQTQSPTSQFCDDSISLPDEINDFFAQSVKRLTPSSKSPSVPSDQVLCLSPSSMRKTKSTHASPGDLTTSLEAYRECAERLTSVWTDIFNTSLSQAVVQACFKTTIIILVQNRSSLDSLNDYSSITLILISASWTALRD